MTIASEIQRLQGAKADIKTAIENKWVSVPAETTLSWYSSYIDAIDTGSIDAIFMPASIVIPDAFYNKKYRVDIPANWWDTYTADENTYYHYFRVRDDSTTAYSDYHLCVRIKTPWNDPTIVESQAYGTDRFSWRAVDWRMKRSGNNIIYSALYYEFTSSTSSAKDHYYCINATNSTFSSVVNCWIIEDIWRDAVYNNWTNSCWITDSESLAAMWKTSLSITSSGSSNYYDLRATINRS